MKRVKFQYIRILIMAGLAALFVAFFSSSFMYGITMRTNDIVYREASQVDDRILVVGIDSYALEKIGSWPWDRKVMAEVINKLFQDEEFAPAVVGVDVVYSNYTNEESDTALLKAVEGRNVVFASTVTFTNSVFEEESMEYLNDFSAKYPSYPFEELKNASVYGHVNAMYDQDGVLRHHLWEIELVDGTKVPSFPKEVFSLYQKSLGLSDSFEPNMNSRGFWPVHYTSNPGDYYAYSVADILYDNYDPSLFEGKIVLIGPYDSTLSDSFLTSRDYSEKMYGVEYLANVIVQTLNFDIITRVSKNTQMLVLFIFILCFECFCMNKELSQLIILSIAGIIVSSGGAILLYRCLGYMINVLWLPLSCFCISMIGLCEHYYMDLNEKMKITKLFNRYVDPSITKELIRYGTDDLQLGGKKEYIAVLFVDIRGYTRISEELSAEDVVDILNEFLSLASRCIMKNGGTLDKFIGDCAMAFWGAPLKCSNPVYLACKAAMDMQNESKELANRIVEKYKKNISFGIGIHYGTAVIGNIGSLERMDYTAIGDTVNVASRLENIAKPGTVYISETVKNELLGTKAVIEEVDDSIQLKGKTMRLSVYQLNRLEED